MSENEKRESTKKLRIGIFWNVFGTIGSKVLMMMASIITARLLGAAHNGEFGMVYNTVGMFSTFAALGLGTTATRFIVEYNRDDKKRCGNVIAMTMLVAVISSTLFSIALLFSSGWLADNSLNNPILADGLRWSSIMLIANTINTVQNSILAGFEDFKGIAKIAIIQGIVSLPVFIITTIIGDVNGLIIGYGIVGVISMFIARHRIVKRCHENSVKATYRTCFSERKLLVKFALPSLLMNAVVLPITWFGNTIIVAGETGYYDLGVFNAANQWRSAISLLPAAIGNVILPFIISNDDSKVEDLNIMLSWYIVIIISSGVTLISGLITMFYGSDYDYRSLNSSMIIICAICALLSFKEGIARNLIKYNHVWFGFFSNLLWGICYIVSIIFLKQYHAEGIALSYLLSYMVSTIVFVPFYISRKIVDKKYFLNSKIMILWLVYGTYLVVSLFVDNIIVKLVLFVITMFVAYRGCDYFFNVTAIIKNLLQKKKKI